MKDENEFPDYMETNTPEGTKIQFTALGGWDWEQENAKKKLVLNGIYTVENIRIRSWYSYVTLKEVKDEIFNTMLFTKVK